MPPAPPRSSLHLHPSPGCLVGTATGARLWTPTHNSVLAWIRHLGHGWLPRPPQGAGPSLHLGPFSGPAQCGI